MFDKSLASRRWISRRRMLQNSSTGFGAVALAGLMSKQATAEAGKG